MLTKNEILSNLAEFESQLGFNPADVEQGSSEWHSMRLGVITASRAHAIIKTGRGGKGYSADRDVYMLELISEVMTKESKFFNSKQVAWGKEHENGAVVLYEFMADNKVDDVPFIYQNESMRVGVSPDGICKDRGLEIKCPYTTPVYLEFLMGGKIKPEYVTQCQFSMWVTGAKQWDFCNYDPRVSRNGLHFVTLERNQETMTKFDIEIPQFIEEMDHKLTKLGFTFGEQWPNYLTELKQVA